MPGKKELFFKRDKKKVGCFVIFAIWLVLSTLLAVAAFSVFPVAVNTFDLSGGWVTVALVSNAIISFVASGFIVAVGMGVFAGFTFVALIMWGILFGKGVDVR